MLYESIVEKLLDENNNDVIELGNADGVVVRFEQVATVTYDGKNYAILHPIDGKPYEYSLFAFTDVDEDVLEAVNDEELVKKIWEVVKEDVDDED